MKASPRPADLSPARSRKQNSGTQPGVTARPEADRIAQRAYERYEARGRADGRDLEDWYEAERELQGMSADSTAGNTRDVNSDEAA